MALGITTLTALVTMQSIQLGCAAAIVVLTIGLYVRDRTAGLVAVWIVWLVMPLLRRIFLISSPIQNADPLALVPFLVTAAVIALELSLITLSPRVRRILLLAVAGYALGLPLGLLTVPSAAVFAFFAYVTALGCFVIGYREAEERRLVLPTVLMIATPLLALYAFRQYYLPLPKWDLIWERSADITSVGAVEAHRIRVWSTLNSPATFATVLGVATFALVSWRRVTPLRLLGGLAVLGALALTYVRSAWAALLIAAIAVVLVTRGGALRRIAPIALALVILAPVVLSGSTRAAIGDRFNTFGFLGQDESANARTSSTKQLGSRAVSDPLGTGLGTAGEANRLAGAEGVRATDSAFLSILYQTGPAGLVAIMTAVVIALRSAWRNAWWRRESTDVLVFAALTFLAVVMLAGDVLYGIGGMIFWYMSGLAVRRRELYEAP